MISVSRSYHLCACPRNHLLLGCNQLVSYTWMWPVSYTWMWIWNAVVGFTVSFGRNLSPRGPFYEYIIARSQELLRWLKLPEITGFLRNRCVTLNYRSACFYYPRSYSCSPKTNSKISTIFFKLCINTRNVSGRISFPLAFDWLPRFVCLELTTR